LSDENEENAAAWQAFDVAAAATASIAAASVATGSGGGGGGGSAEITMAVGDVAATRSDAGATLLAAA